MEHLTFTYEGKPIDRHPAVLVGVVSSGNLEVLIESIDDSRCLIDVNTAARGFDAVWTAVLGDFVARAALGGVRISINDAGATPAVVSLRLDQARKSFLAGAA